MINAVSQCIFYVMDGFKLHWHYICCCKHTELHININMKFNALLEPVLKSSSSKCNCCGHSCKAWYMMTSWLQENKKILLKCPAYNVHYHGKKAKLLKFLKSIAWWVGLYWRLKHHYENYIPINNSISTHFFFLAPTHTPVEVCVLRKD